MSNEEIAAKDGHLAGVCKILIRVNVPKREVEHTSGIKIRI